LTILFSKYFDDILSIFQFNILSLQNKLIMLHNSIKGTRLNESKMLKPAKEIVMKRLDIVVSPKPKALK